MGLFSKQTALASAFFVLCAATLALSPPLESAPKPFLVRVLVAQDRTYIFLTVKGGYSIKALPSGKTVKSGEGLRAKLLPVQGGFRLGGEQWAATGLSIEPSSDRDLYLDNSRFRGTVSVFKSPSGNLLYAVNRIDIEKYLYGVLHHEVAPWWPMEALKAQAVAARTYAYYQAQVSKSNPYDLKSSTSSQVYGGSTTERYRTKKAVDRTVGQVLTYEGKVFPAYFHATCAGITAGAQELWKINLPPIAGGAKCGYCRISPHFYWQAKVPLSSIEAKMKSNGKAIGQILKIEPVTRTPSNRVGSLKITGTQGESVVAAKDFRIWVGGDLMKSTDFTVGVREDVAEFHGKGWGHGVGLCQWGTLGQALLGRAYKDILSHYYPSSLIADYRRF